MFNNKKNKTMKKELEEFQKAYANAMKHEIDYYSNADFKESDFLPEWVEVKCHVEGVLIEFSFHKSRAIFAEHNFRGDTIMEYYFTDEEKQELHKKVVDAYYRKRLKSLDSKIDELMKEKEKISEEKISEEQISVEQNQTI